MTYERKVIERYIEIHHKDPVSGNPLMLEQLIPNRRLIEILEAHQKSNDASLSNTKSNKRFSLFELSASLRAIEDDNVPDFLCCEISGEIMKDPVMTPTGRTYERDEIGAWIERDHSDPASRAPLTVHQLIPNLALKAVIEAREKTNEKRPSLSGN